MPHLIIEFSANLDQRLDMAWIVRSIHDAALETGVFPIGGVRTRAIRHDIYLVADKHPGNAFIHVQARIGQGRTDDVRAKAAEHIFAALKRETAQDRAANAIGLTFEIVEIASVGSLKENTLHDHVARRAKA